MERQTSSILDKKTFLKHVLDLAGNRISTTQQLIAFQNNLIREDHAISPLDHLIWQSFPDVSSQYSVINSDPDFSHVNSIINTYIDNWLEKTDLKEKTIPRMLAQEKVIIRILREEMNITSGPLPDGYQTGVEGLPANVKNAISSRKKTSDTDRQLFFSNGRWNQNIFNKAFTRARDNFK